RLLRGSRFGGWLFCFGQFFKCCLVNFQGSGLFPNEEKPFLVVGNGFVGWSRFSGRGGRVRSFLFCTFGGCRFVGWFGFGAGRFYGRLIFALFTQRFFGGACLAKPAAQCQKHAQ